MFLAQVKVQWGLCHVAFNLVFSRVYIDRIGQSVSLNLVNMKTHLAESIFDNVYNYIFYNIFFIMNC